MDSWFVFFFDLMKTQVFESFAEMMDGVPAKEILKAAELERQALKNDSLYKRVLDKDVASIFSFCEFMKAVVDEDNILTFDLPKTHTSFYRKTVMRLIEAGELPRVAQEQFDRTFSSNSINALA